MLVLVVVDAVLVVVVKVVMLWMLLVVVVVVVMMMVVGVCGFDLPLPYALYANHHQEKLVFETAANYRQLLL